MELNPPLPLPSASAPRGRRWIWWLGWVAATVFLLCFYRPFDWREVASHFTQAQPTWVTVAVILNLGILAFWIALWRQFLPAAVRVSWRIMSEIVALSAATMNTVPFMGGHALAVSLLTKRGGTGMEVALSVMTLDQLCEGICKVLLLLLAMSVAPLPDWMRRAIWVIGAAMLVLLIVLLWLARQPAAKNGTLARWARHFEILTHPRLWLAGLALSLGTKLAEAAAIYAVQLSLGVDLPPATLALVLGAISVATMISVSPGNLGMYEAAAFAAYTLLGIPAEQAVALALVQHACFLAAMIIPGYALTAWRSLRPAT